jgi:Fe-S-cluster-containing dehydrogenase component
VSGIRRRDFIEALGAGAVALILPRGLARAQAPASAPAEYNWEEHLFCYLIDVKRCIGCGMCVRACKRENAVPDDFYRTWIERYLVSLHDVYVDSPKGALDGFGPVQTPFEPSKGFFVPKLCNHCKETPCVQVCPVGASYRSKDGLVLVDAKRCIGCGYCVQACPYGSRFMNPRTHTADKCTWCYHRITRGLLPACVQACPTGTRRFGDLKQEDDPVRKIIATESVRVLQPELLTEPHCFYLGLDKEVR